MTYDEFIHLVKETSGGKFTLAESRLAFESVVDAFKDIMLNHDTITIKGFGKIGSKKKKGHIGRNPATKKEYKIPDHYVPFFSASDMLKEEVF